MLSSGNFPFELRWSQLLGKPVIDKPRSCRDLAPVHACSNPTGVWGLVWGGWWNRCACSTLHGIYSSFPRRRESSRPGERMGLARTVLPDRGSRVFARDDENKRLRCTRGDENNMCCCARKAFRAPVRRDLPWALSVNHSSKPITIVPGIPTRRKCGFLTTLGFARLTHNLPRTALPRRWVVEDEPQHFGCAGCATLAMYIHARPCRKRCWMRGVNVSRISSTCAAATIATCNRA